MTIKAKVKTKFISRAEMQEKLDNQKRRVLYKTGAYALRIIQNRIRRRAPRTRTKSGELRKRRRTKYPTQHAPGNSGLRAIRYDVDIAKKDVLIGVVRYYDTPRIPTKPNGRPIGLPGARVTVFPMGGKTIPQILNEGGSGKLHAEYSRGIGYGYAEAKSFTKVVQYQKQPFVTDALDKAQKRMARLIAQNKLRS